MRPVWQLAFALGLASLAAMPAASQDPLAVVNGEGITRDALVHRLIDLGTAGQAQLEEMINEALLFQAAQEKGITASDEEIDARAAGIEEKLASEERFKAYLADQGVTHEGFRHKLRVKLLVEKLLSEKATVTDEEVKNAYDENKASFEAPETATLRMILTKTKEQADEAMKRLDAGENFADVAKELSINAFTAERGGLMLRPVSRANLRSPALVEAAFTTEVGKYAQPVETPDGYYIFKVEARTAATSKSFDDVKEAIRAELQEMKLQSAWVAWLEDARKQASIERKWQP